jgi:cysteine desulfurase
MIYLDWAATALPMRKIHTWASEKAVELFANPSSTHQQGKAARACIEDARETCGKLLNANPKNIYFSSGGSESNNIILTSLLGRTGRGSLVVAGIEHPSVYEPSVMLEKAGFTVKYVKAEKNGVVDPERFAAVVDDDTIMAAVMLVNNETGAVQPVKAISKLIRGKTGSTNRYVHLHCDAVQAFGKIDVSVMDLGIDSLSASGHKLGAPRGAGVLFLKRPLDTIYRGGGQESGLRPGTENLQAIFGLGMAIEKWNSQRAEWVDHARELRVFVLDRISKIPGAAFFDHEYLAPDTRYSPFIVLASFPPIPGEVLVRVMSDRGFAISTGSACSSRGKKNLRVLRQMGIADKFAGSAVRISTGPDTRRSDCESFCNALEREVTNLRGQMGKG